MFRRIPPRPTRRTRFPAQKKDEVISGAYFSLEEDAYAVLNACGTYDLYYNGEYLETVDSLKGYEGMHIHN